MTMNLPGSAHTLPEPILRRAVNSAVDSENKIHSDAEARRFGYQGALVPGVTLYAYLTQLVLPFFGPEWLRRGHAALQIIRPVYAGEVVRCEAAIDGESGGGDRPATGAPRLQALCLRPDGKTAALLTAWLGEEDEDALAEAPELPAIAPPATLPRLAPGSVPLGRPLAPLDTHFTTDDAAAYAAETEDACSWWRGSSPFGFTLLPPGIIAGRQARLLRHNFAYGPSIHTASAIRHLAPTPANGHYRTGGVIRDTFERNGHQYLVLDALTTADGVPVARVRHTAIFQVRGS